MIGKVFHLNYLLLDEADFWKMDLKVVQHESNIALTIRIELVDRSTLSWIAKLNNFMFLTIHWKYFNINFTIVPAE